MPNRMGCALCKKGFVRNGVSCIPCSVNCASCNTAGCIPCDDAFWLNTTSLSCLPFETLTHCTAAADSKSKK